MWQNIYSFISFKTLFSYQAKYTQKIHSQIFSGSSDSSDSFDYLLAISMGSNATPILTITTNIKVHKENTWVHLGLVNLMILWSS